MVEIPDDFPLKQEWDAFEARRAELLAAHPGRYAIVHGAEIADVFPRDEFDAVDEAYRRYGNVPFMVKRITATDPVERVSYPAA